MGLEGKGLEEGTDTDKEVVEEQGGCKAPGESEGGETRSFSLSPF